MKMEGQDHFRIDVEGILLNWVNYVHNLIDLTSEHQVNSDDNINLEGTEYQSLTGLLINISLILPKTFVNIYFNSKA